MYCVAVQYTLSLATPYESKSSTIDFRRRRTKALLCSCSDQNFVLCIPIAKLCPPIPTPHRIHYYAPQGLLVKCRLRFTNRNFFSRPIAVKSTLINCSGRSLRTSWTEIPSVYNVSIDFTTPLLTQLNELAKTRATPEFKGNHSRASFTNSDRSNLDAYASRWLIDQTSREIDVQRSVLNDQEIGFAVAKTSS